MTGATLVRDAVASTFRNRSRTLLTVLAIVIGAFTITLTSAVSAGGGAFITSTVAATGSPGTLSVTSASDAANGPRAYDRDSGSVSSTSTSGRPRATTVAALDDDDLATLRGIRGVEAVVPTLAVSLDYVGVGSDRYVATIAGLTPGTSLDLAAGRQLSTGDRDEVVLSSDYVDALGFAGARDAVGSTVDLGVGDATGAAHVVTATVVGVANAGVVAGSGLTANDALDSDLYAAQSTGLSTPAKDRYASASVRVDASQGTAHVEAVQRRLDAAGYASQSVAQQLGTVQTVIDAITIVLDGFALIALIAAGIGIVNTMLTSVQERTREIGLMRALGLSGRGVFGLFSLEAVVIGMLGSLIGVGAAVGLGTLLDTVLAGGVLSALPGLTLLIFNPGTIAVVIGVILAIALVAGIVPAVVAARKHPIDALRYE